MSQQDQRQKQLEEVVALRRRSLTFGQIAMRYGVNRSTAWRMYQEGTRNEQAQQAEKPQGEASSESE